MRVDWLDLKVPPLALTIAAAAVVVLAQRLHTGATVVEPVVAHFAGGVIAFTGLALAVRGVIDFRRARTTVDPRHPERSARIVTDGVYRWTRNPMYLGFVLLLLALAIALQSPFGLLVMALSAGFLQRFQIAPEERWLRVHFGAEYDAYRARVRRSL
jgi:protein-S-isoprenylcysteine O-methyltransferase Ste14